jgi:protein arginine kinase
MTLPNFLSQNPWDKPCQALWPLSCFSLKRNLKREPFPHRQQAACAKNILEKISKIISQCVLTKDLVAIDLSALSPDQKDRLFTQLFLETSDYEDRPYQALFCNPSKTLAITINIDNHLRLHTLDYHNQEFTAWNTLVEIDNYFAKELDYAFTPRFGYLTKNIQDCGLGLEAKACLHLPLLSSSQKEFSLLETVCETSEVALIKHPYFAIVTLNNKFNLGYTEESLMKALQEKAQVFIDKERHLRSALPQEQIETLKKSISSSYGVLLHGRYLNFSDVQHALSVIKLGVDLKWIEGIHDATINHVLFQKTSKEIEPLLKDSIKNLTLLF